MSHKYKYVLTHPVLDQHGVGLIVLPKSLLRFVTNLDVKHRRIAEYSTETRLFRRYNYTNRVTDTLVFDTLDECIGVIFDKKEEDKQKRLL